ncbi:MAG TPA: M3 family oligoendopeptidase [Bacillota bacterium]|nr:M3 family oligoendopeptidase [Bacillota bacterium]
MVKELKQTWDLDAIFPGGSDSREFAKYLDNLEQQIEIFSKELKPGFGQDKARFLDVVERVQDISKKLRHASAFVSCLGAQDVHDTKARILAGRVKQIAASFAQILATFDDELLEIPDEQWAKLIEETDSLKEIAFNLSERRERAKEMLSPEQEQLVSKLSVNGYHGWSDLYDLTSGKMTIEVEINGEKLVMSPGQLSNRMSDPDPSVRSYLMETWENAWSEASDYCGMALNQLAGFRLNLYEARGWKSVLKEPLLMNRMNEDTLDTMWHTVDSNKEGLVRYLRRKKEYLGLEKLGWQDIDAPIGKATSKLTYDEAARFIVEQFERFNPDMARFAERAFIDRWIESEDRPGKRMGGFCTSFPENKQSRIFVTFSGSLGNMATIAHELGHGFHQHLVFELPVLSQQYAMNVAETASTFAEIIVADAAVKYAKDPEEKLMLLDDKLSRAVALLMNIQSRFLFETRFYEERKQGIVSTQRLNEIMLQAQKEAFRDTLDVYHPHFWASKLHFYNTGVPFYNFPYTFGFLFSAGVYAKALEEGPSFREKYASLLRDTGRMKVEDLAKKHLGVDLTKPEFWEASINLVTGDLDAFMEMTSEKN